MSDTFYPIEWTELEIVAKAQAVGIDLPSECLPGVKANLALLEDRWITLLAALPEAEA